MKVMISTLLDFRGIPLVVSHSSIRWVFKLPFLLGLIWPDSFSKLSFFLLYHYSSFTYANEMLRSRGGVCVDRLPRIKPKNRPFPLLRISLPVLDRHFKDYFLGLISQTPDENPSLYIYVTARIHQLGSSWVASDVGLPGERRSCRLEEQICKR